MKNYKIDPVKIAESLNISIIPYKFSDNISGVFFKKDGKLFLGVNSDQHEHRQRFTTAHEIGHFILHSQETLHFDTHKELADDVSVLFRADNISSFEEMEANHFAAELLMPEEFVVKLIDIGTISINELAKNFDVSQDAMKYRLINLGYL